MSSPRSIPIFRTLGVAIAILGGLAFAPGRAAAGCGEYNMPDHQPSLGQLAADHGQTPAKPRCHGPNCSKVPTAPAPLPKAPVPLPTGDDLTGVLFDNHDFAVASRPFPADLFDRSPARLAAVIYHPPR